MNSSLIDVNAAYDIEKVICYCNSPIFDDLRASWLSDLVFVWVQHLYALNAQDIPQNAVRDESKQNRAKSNILSVKPLCDYRTYSSMRNFHWNVQNAIIWTILGLCDSKSFRLYPEAKFCISFDLGLSQKISADFVELFSRDCLCTTVFTVV